MQNAGGTTVLKGNKLTGCQGIPFLVQGSLANGVTYFSDDNSTDSPSQLRAKGPSNFDNSVKKLPRGVAAPSQLLSLPVPESHHQ
jgi:hypothetical protein